MGCRALAFGALGYAFGENLPRLERYAGQAGLALALLVALVAALLLGGRWFRDHRAELAERATLAWQRVACDPRLAEFRRRHAKLWTFVAARFAPAEYLGLHLTIGLALSLGALWIFAAITEDVLNHDPLTLFDLRVADWLVAHATARGQGVAVALSLVGSPPSMAALALAVAIILTLRRRWVLVAGWAAAFAGGGILDWALKVAIRRPRPPGAEAFLHGASFSFPSGHSMGSLIGFGMLAYLLVAFWAKRWWSKVAIGAAVGVLVLAIGASRLYLGVHYFSDVIGGFAAGAVWLSACVSGCEVALRERRLAPWEVGSIGGGRRGRRYHSRRRADGRLARRGRRSYIGVRVHRPLELKGTLPRHPPAHGAQSA